MKKIFQNFSNFQKGIVLISLSLFFMIMSYVFTRWTVKIYNIALYDVAFWSTLGSILLAVPYILFSTTQQSHITQTIERYPKALFLTLLLSPLGAGLWFFLITFVPSDIISLFDQTSIVWSVIFGIFFLRERIGLFQSTALILSGIGIFLISQAEVIISPLVLGTLLFIPLIYALQSLIIKKYAKGIDGFSLAWLRAVWMGISFGIVFFAMGKLTLLPWEVFLYLGLAQGSGMIINRMFYIKAHEYLPMSQLNFFYILVPVIIFFISPFIEQDFGFYPIKYFGAGLVILGLLIFMWRRKK